MYDSVAGNKCTVHKPGYDVDFIESPNGLYYHDMSDMLMSFHISTVKGNRQIVTRREYEQTVKARKLYAMVGQPSISDFTGMIKMNLLLGSPVTTQDVKNAKFLFGKDIKALKGKTTRKTPEPVTNNYINVPQELIDLHQDVTIAADIMYVNKVPFLTSVSRKIKFTTV
eukprot:14051030-Ditylum_brightwellii.AAC.1